MSKPKPAVKYSEAIGDSIANLLADGLTLNAICQLEGMPTERAVRLWALDAAHPFSPKYTRGRELGYQRMADELITIADGKPDADPQRDRLRLDTRKWLLSKALPKIYGDKIAVTDADGGPVQIKFVK